jgi:hypothetical protein
MQKAFELDQRSNSPAAGGNAAQREEGQALAVELIQKLKGTPGVKGVHLMVPHQEDVVPWLAKEAELSKPVVRDLAALRSPATPSVEASLKNTPGVGPG